MKAITFYGQTGIGYGFEQADVAAGWFKQPGVAVFAAPDAYGWRVIRVVELSGREHDVRPFWALQDAEKYGASAVFLSLLSDHEARQSMINDLESGLSPVVSGAQAGLALAA